MDTPLFQQLTGLRAYLYAQLRADGYLTGSGVGQLQYTADQVLKTTYPHKMFVEFKDGIAPITDWGKMNVPALAIYVDVAEYSNDIKASIGQECTLGFQYVWPSRAKEVTSEAFAAHFGMAIWMAICRIITADMTDPAGVLRNTYHIEEIGLESMRPMLPFGQPVRAWQAEGSMCFKREMWDTGADSSQVVDLASIHTDHNETGPTGASPIVQSIYEPE